MANSEITREQLYDLVWSTPMTRLAAQYSISDAGLRKICKKMEIPLPKAGHWEKLKAGKEVEVEKLSRNYSGMNEFDLTSKLKDYSSKYSTPNELELLLKEIETALGSNLEVPEKLKKPYELIREAKKNMEASKKSRDLLNGLIYSRKGFCFNVTPKNANRALRFMNSLFKVIIERGHEIKYDSSKHKLIFKIKGEDFEIVLREKTKRFEVKTKYGWNNTIKEPSGVLVLQAIGWLRGESIWQDGNMPIENQVSRILGGLEIKSMKITEARNEWKKRQELRNKEIQKEKEQETLIAYELERVKQLLKDVEYWKIAMNIRNYIQDSILKSENYSENEIEWALKKADWIDPVVNRHDELLKEAHHYFFDNGEKNNIKFF